MIFLIIQLFVERITDLDTSVSKEYSEMQFIYSHFCVLYVPIQSVFFYVHFLSLPEHLRNLKLKSPAEMISIIS